MITKKCKVKTKNLKKKDELVKKNKKKIREKINPNLICPMNEIFNYRPPRAKKRGAAIPTSEFWIKHELDDDRRRCKKVEDLIEKYQMDLRYFWGSTTANRSVQADGDISVTYEDFVAMEEKFEELIEDIKQTYISKNYLGLMSWLLNRAFFFDAAMKKNKETVDSITHRNRILLIKALYKTSPSAFLRCFSTKSCTPST